MNTENLPRAEGAVLGSLILEPEISGELFHRLAPEDFSDPTLRTMFTAARELWLEKKPVDPVTLLSRTGTEYGDALKAVMDGTPTAANWEEYAGIVSDSAQLRRIQSAAVRIIEARAAGEARDALAAAQALLVDRNRKNSFSWLEMSDSFLTRAAGEPERFLDWGIPELSEHLKIRPHSFVVLAAESSVGKTALALQISFAMARGGKRVGFFSLETFQEEATDRMMAQLTGIPLPAIRGHRLGPDAIKRAFDIAQATCETPFDLIQAAGYTVDEIRAETLARGYEVVFIDYVQLLSAKGESPSEQVRSISMDLHRMTQELGVTVVGLSQVTPPPKNQKGQRAELGKDNLRESHQLIHDAEAILVMDLSDLDDYNSNRVLKIDKNKDGPRGRMILAFDAPRMRFSYVPPVEDSDIQNARARNEKMDENRKRRQEKERRKRGVEGQGSFEDVPDDGDLPF